MPHINDLPNRILVSIFSQLQPKCWITCSSVCTRWNDVIDCLLQTVTSLDFDGLFLNEIKTTDGCKYQINFTPVEDVAHKSILRYSLFSSIMRRCRSLHHFSIGVNDNNIIGCSFVITVVTKCCPKLKSLSLNGSLILVIQELSLLAANVFHLEKLYVNEESYIDEELNCEKHAVLDDDEPVPCDDAICHSQIEVKNSGDLVHKFLNNCKMLRHIDLRFPYVRSCRSVAYRHLSTLKLENFTWMVCKPYDADYIQILLDNLTDCLQTLKRLIFFCEIKKPLDNIRFEAFFDLLSKSSIEFLGLGFQLMIRSYMGDITESLNNLNLEDNGQNNGEVLLTDSADHFDASNSEYFECKDEAPWSYIVFKDLPRFEHLKELTLRNLEFTFDEDLPLRDFKHFEVSELEASFSQRIPDYLREVAKQLTVLRLEENYNLNDSFLTACFNVPMKHLSVLEVYGAKLTAPVLSHVVCTYFPVLCHLLVSNIDRLSFKELVLGIHRTLHQCNLDRKQNLDLSFTHPLLIQLGTAPGYRFKEAEELKTLNFCGLELYQSYTKIKIHRICTNVN